MSLNNAAYIVNGNIVKGTKGDSGNDGQDGLGIKSVDINVNNHLVVTYDDDTIEDAGLIPDGFYDNPAYKTSQSIGINVKDYGAVGDGVTDDSQAFINAMTAAVSANKSVILIPAGTYDLNHATMDLTAAFSFIGQNSRECTILNSKIYAPYGIACNGIIFDGGSVRESSYYETGWNSALYPQTVALLVTPEYANANVIYSNCTFRNVGLASVAFHAQNNDTPIVENNVQNCLFENIGYFGILHSVNITNALIISNTFNNIGDTTITVGSVGGVKLGDTWGLTNNRVENCSVSQNMFDTLSSAYDLSSASHTIDCNFIGVNALKAVITSNILENMNCFGNDREGIYTKGTDIEVCYNELVNAGAGEAYICCKGGDAQSNKISYVHHNRIIGEYGEAIRIYGSGIVHDNYIAIKKLCSAVRFFKHFDIVDEFVEIYDNHVDSGIGQVYIDGTEVTTYDPANIFFVSHKFNAGICIKNNFISITSENEFTKTIEAAVKIQNISSDAEILDNVINTEDTIGKLLVIGSSASYPDASKKITIDVENNCSKALSSGGINLSFNSSNSYLLPMLIIKNNTFESVPDNKYSVNIGGAEHTVTLYYESNQAANAFAKKQVYISPSVCDYIYTQLTDAFFQATNATLVSTDFIDYKSVSWGAITGTLANQTDLKNALDAKADADLFTITPASENLVDFSESHYNWCPAHSIGDDYSDGSETATYFATNLISYTRNEKIKFAVNEIPSYFRAYYYNENNKYIGGSGSYTVDTDGYYYISNVANASYMCFVFGNTTEANFRTLNAGRYDTFGISKTIVNDLYLSDKNVAMAKERLGIETGDILYGKKWAVAGDSFTAGGWASGEAPTIPDGIYAGQPAVYPYLIGNRCGITIQNLSKGGRTLALPSGETSSYNSFINYYQNVAADADYLTIYLGINDAHHSDVIPLGAITDNVSSSFYGAWNVILSWLIENRPNLHIGIIASNGCGNDDYRVATIEIAGKYGIPYIDMNGDSKTPCMIRSTNPNIASAVKTQRNLNWRVSSENTHPNAACHAYEATFIENFLRSL